MAKKSLKLFIKSQFDNMGFFKKDNIYKIIRNTGLQDNILGVVFEVDSKDTNIEVIEWNFPNIRERKVQTSKEEVLNQVLSGLKSVNESLGTNYKLSQIYFSPFDSPSQCVYHLLICKLIRHYHFKKEFKEV